MPTLYYAPGACSLAVHITLEWIGAPYEARRVAYGSPELLAVNPSGAVPTFIEDDGWILTQNGAILDYLVHKHPAAGLGPEAGIRGGAEMHRWSSFFTGDLHPAFFPVFLPSAYTKGDASAQKLVKESGFELVHRRLRILNAHLDGRDWILDRRSVMDAYAFPMIRWAIRLLPGGLEPYPYVQALHDRVAADPSVQRVLEREAK